MAGLRTSTFVRGARLVALPTMYAGRTAVGAAKKVGGAPAEAVSQEIQRRTVEQLCKTLGELKGGALKLGQAMSVFETVMPEELAGPYRQALNAMQHAAPPLPFSVVERVLAEELGADWATQLTIDPKPAGAASIGQVHRGTWHPEGAEPLTVAVKIQYPGVAKALMSDLRQLRRIAKLLSVLGTLADATGLVDELSARLVEELDYTLEASNQRKFAEAFAGDPLIVVPGVQHATTKVLITDWLEGEPLSKHIHDENLTQERRDWIGAALMHAIYAGPDMTGLMHADPHPGNFMLVPDGRIGVLDFGAVKRLPGGIPPALGRMAALVLSDDHSHLFDDMVALDMLSPDAPITSKDLTDYASSMSEPFRNDSYTFTRSWMRAEAVRLANPKSSTHIAAKHLNLPTEYLMVHRVAIGVVGLLCQLDANVPARHQMIRWNPGFRATVAEQTGIADEVLLADSANRLTELFGAFGRTVPGQRKPRAKKVAAAV